MADRRFFSYLMIIVVLCLSHSTVIAQRIPQATETAETAETASCSEVILTNLNLTEGQESERYSIAMTKQNITNNTMINSEQQVIQQIEAESESSQFKEVSQVNTTNPTEITTESEKKIEVSLINTAKEDLDVDCDENLEFQGYDVLDIEHQNNEHSEVGDEKSKSLLYYLSNQDTDREDDDGDDDQDCSEPIIDIVSNAYRRVDTSNSDSDSSDGSDHGRSDGSDHSDSPLVSMRVRYGSVNVSQSSLKLSLSVTTAVICVLQILT